MRGLELDIAMNRVQVELYNKLESTAGHRRDGGAGVQNTIGFDVSFTEGSIQAREAEKRTKYGDACARNGLTFHPLVFDTFGNFSKLSKCLVEGLARQAYARLVVEGHSREVTEQLYVRYWLTRISVVVQSMIAKAMIRKYRVLLHASAGGNQLHLDESRFTSTITSVVVAC